MPTDRARLRHAGARLWGALVTLVVLVSLALAGRGYLYCHMAERAMTSCCCASAPGLDVGAVDESRCHDADAATRPCCEQRDGEMLPTATVELPEMPLGQVQRAAEDVAPPRFAPPVGWIRTAQRPAALHESAPARAGPTRRGKRRARLGVTIC